MAKRSKPSNGPEPFKGYVPAIYARNLVEAEFYKSLLVARDIPAIIEDAASESVGIPASIVGQGVPVLVPDVMLDEASEILAEHEDIQEDEELADYEETDEQYDDFDDDEDFEGDDLDDFDEDDLDDEDEDEDLDEGSEDL